MAHKANVLGIEIYTTTDAEHAARAIADEIGLAIGHMSVLNLKKAHFAAGVLERELKRLIAVSQNPNSRHHWPSKSSD